MQLPGHLIAADIQLDDETRKVVSGTGRIGLVESVSTETDTQKALLVKDVATGEVVQRIERPDITVEVVSGVWEDGSKFELRQGDYVTLGSVVELDKGVTSLDVDNQRTVDTAAADFVNYAQAIRDAAPFVEAAKAAERTLVVEEED